MRHGHGHDLGGSCGGDERPEPVGFANGQAVVGFEREKSEKVKNNYQNVDLDIGKEGIVFTGCQDLWCNRFQEFGPDNVKFDMLSIYLNGDFIEVARYSSLDLREEARLEMQI